MNRTQLLKAVAKKYGVQPEYLWTRWPNYAVLRHSDNRKWFAILMDVPTSRLGLNDADADEHGRVDILNVKVDPDDAIVLQLADSIMPAYHMNKKNWISIVIKGDVPDELILELLETSHRLTA